MENLWLRIAILVVGIIIIVLYYFLAVKPKSQYRRYGERPIRSPGLFTPKPDIPPMPSEPPNDVQVTRRIDPEELASNDDARRDTAKSREDLHGSSDTVNTASTLTTDATTQTATHIDPSSSPSQKPSARAASPTMAKRSTNDGSTGIASESTVQKTTTQPADHQPTRQDQSDQEAMSASRSDNLDDLPDHDDASAQDESDIAKSGSDDADKINVNQRTAGAAPSPKEVPDHPQRASSTDDADSTPHPTDNVISASETTSDQIERDSDDITFSSDPQASHPSETSDSTNLISDDVQIDPTEPVSAKIQSEPTFGLDNEASEPDMTIDGDEASDNDGASANSAHSESTATAHRRSASSAAGKAAGKRAEKAKSRDGKRRVAGRTSHNQKPGLMDRLFKRDKPSSKYRSPARQTPEETDFVYDDASDNIEGQLSYTPNQSDSQGETLESHYLQGDDLPTKMVVISLYPQDPNGKFTGAQIKQVMESFSLILSSKSGFFESMNTYATPGRAESVFSVGHLRGKGRFERTRISGLETSGLVFFMLIPGPVNAADSVDMMFSVAAKAAKRLNAQLCDQKRKKLTVEQMINIRDEAVAFEKALIEKNLL